ncbi:MAG TPA: chitobiase/beta-hexosaminidase C-terminal domain-containing protein [Chthonomonadales bacterium]|nr:chitobiase/beta-hexosaminidase C-terminal domain-containing protein [Chthonomonadales bacterium]
MHVAALFAALFLAVGAAARAQEPVTPRAVQTRFATEDLVVASAVVSPPRAGGNASALLQAAIDRVAAAGGGVVFAHGGRYRLEAPLTVREGVTLRGDRPLQRFDGARRPVDPRGTVLMPVSHRGEPDGPPALALERGSGVRDLTIWHPDQRASAPTPYPWTLRGSTTRYGNNYTVMNVTLVNSYQGIRFGPEWNELHTIQNVVGTCLRAGIFVDFCTDIGRLTGIDFGPEWWERSGLPGSPRGEGMAALRAWMRREGIGVDIGRSDWEYLHAVRMRGFAAGFRFRPGVHGTTNAVMVDCHASDGAVGLLVEQLNAVGLSATGSSFSGSDAGIRTAAGFTGVVQLQDSTLRASRGPAADLRGDGAVTFQGCRFAGARGPAIAAVQGVVTALGCTWSASARRVVIGERVRRARVLGALGPVQPVIENRSRGDVQWALTATGFAPTPRVGRLELSMPAPPRRTLRVVTDYGASASLPDNTAAFARALASARRAGGGTVYVPPGYWRLGGTLRVPSGVELRGSFDVPHHKVTGGSVLLTTHGAGNEQAAPFISLEPRSGLRGLTVWYPEQHIRAVRPYPWAIRALGPGCWLLDVTLGNAYNGADFWTHPSDGHAIRYLAGGFLRRGLFVSKSRGGGRIEDLQFNPHYMARLPDALPRPAYEGDWFPELIDYQQANLEGIVLGRTVGQLLRGTFLFAARQGLALRSDGGGPCGLIIQHGTDAGSYGVHIEATGAAGVDFVNPQLVVFGRHEVCSIYTAPSFSGRVALHNAQLWAGSVSAILRGRGHVMVQQMNTLTGPIHIEAGRAALVNVRFHSDWRPQVRIGEGCAGARVVGCFGPDVVRIDVPPRTPFVALGNSLSVTPPEGPTELRTSWEPGDLRTPDDTLAVPGGGRRSVSDATCRPVAGAGRDGGHALRIAGSADEREHSFIYFRVAEGQVAIHSDTVLTYWLRPANPLSRHIGIDLILADGTTMRDRGVTDADGVGAHPGTQRGVVGEWRRIEVPIGRQLAGETVTAVLLAYDGRPGFGRFEAFVDDLAIVSAQAGRPWRVAVEPAGGAHVSPLTVRLEAASGAAYTLDGRNPGPGSPRATGPITLRGVGAREIRFSALGPDGTPSGIVFGALYDLRAPASPRRAR